MEVVPASHRRCASLKSPNNCFMKPDEIVIKRVTGSASIRIWGTALFIFLGSALVMAQQSPAPQDQRNAPVPGAQSGPPAESNSVKSLPRNLLIDQKDFWTTPFHMRASQWKWVPPISLVGTILLASDTAVEKHAPTTPSTVSRATSASNAGVAAFAGVGAGMFLWGHLTHNETSRETGFLAGEAAIDAALDAELIKAATGRERPFTGDGRGRFLQGGSSFPSIHASVSFAIASVFAHEYPGPATQILAYGAAGAVDAARFAGQKHFMTDLVVGSALGWYLGRQVYREHSRNSDAELANFGNFIRDDQTVRDTGDMGSSSVPLDSWIYPALQRLQGWGYIDSGFLGMRPWTRMECARLLQQASDRIENEVAGAESESAEEIYNQLAEEFSLETGRLSGERNLGISLDSVYTRVTNVSGLPLRDGFHFAQTIINDYGRPYGQGLNNVTGFTGHSEAGPFFFYLQGEYQHAAPLAALSSTARQTIQNVDGLPTTPPGAPISSLDRFDVLQGYVGLQLSNWQFTFGKQSLWWGEDQSGAMLFSNNAEPVVMLQINRVSPFTLPSFLKVIGPIRASYFVGRLSGYHWVFGVNSGFVGSWTQSLGNQPFIIGEKLSLKPSQNLELGFSVTSLSGATGVPFTLHKIVQASFFGGNGAPGTPNDPGDRRGAFDFAYRLPKLRDWLTLYADAFTDDQANPWLAWNKAAVTSGLYLSHFPRIPNLDLRVEGLYSDPPAATPVQQHGFFYFNDRFRSGYTNDGTLIGSWIGRQGQGAGAWMNYWFTPKNNLQFFFRHQKVSPKFIPDGGTLTDAGVSSNLWVRSHFGISASVQYERWLFPVIQPNNSRNITAAIELQLSPGKLLRSSAASAPASQP